MKLFDGGLLSTGLDKMIFFYSLSKPDFTEDFDGETKVEIEQEKTKRIPEDKEYTVPANYTQPFHTYAKVANCLDYDGKILVAAEKRLIFVWNEGDRLTTLKGHSEMVGKLILFNRTLYSSSCDKTVRIWNIEAQTCTRILRPENQFKNISFPKIAVNEKYLLASSPNHIYIYQPERLHYSDKHMRKVQVPELLTDLHIEEKGLAYSCYNAVHIWNFWNTDETNKPFYGTKTKF